MVSKELEKTLEDRGLEGIWEIEEIEKVEDGKIVNKLTALLPDGSYRSYESTLEVNGEGTEVEDMYIGKKKVKDLSIYMKRAFLPKYKVYRQLIDDMREYKSLNE